MKTKELKKELEKVFKDISVDILENNRISIVVINKQVMPVLRFLKDNGYDHLALISCVDWLEKGEFELVYIVSAYINENNEWTDKVKLNITLKTRISRQEAKFITAIPVFQNAEPYEREIHELFGIKFEGHPRLTPLFLEREYKIPPFRKDFDTRKYVKEVFEEIPFVKESE